MDNDQIYKENRAILEQKWPKILNYMESMDGEIHVTLLNDAPEKTLVFNGCHISSCYNRKHEAEVQNKNIPLSATEAHLYGVGLADAAYDLLSRKKLQRLDVYLLSPTVFYLYLHFFNALDWLSDERIHLHLAHKEELKTPYSVNAGELPFSEDKALGIKNLIEIDKNKENEQRFHQIDLLCDYQENMQKNYAFLHNDPYIETLKQIHCDKPFVVVAGGPTASEQFSWLKEQRENYMIVAASTAMIPLEIEGIIPDYVVAIDPHPGLAYHFSVQTPKKFINTTLVYYPLASYKAIEVWPGKRAICLTSNHPLIKDQLKQHPESILFVGGSVTHAATALSVLLGAQQITLVGCDFCFAYGKAHLQNNPIKNVLPETPDAWVLNGYNKRVPSLLNLISYKIAMEELIAQNPKVTFYNTGKEGAEIKGAKWI